MSTQTEYCLLHMNHLIEDEEGNVMVFNSIDEAKAYRDNIMNTILTGYDLDNYHIVVYE